MQEIIVDPDSNPARLEAVFGRNLKAARLNTGLSQQELASRAGVAFCVLVEIERGDSDPDLRVIGALARALGLAAFELLKL
jgi:transcriptional regulator with XRE-family HTH domain